MIQLSSNLETVLSCQNSTILDIRSAQTISANILSFENQHLFLTYSLNELNVSDLKVIVGNWGFLPLCSIVLSFIHFLFKHDLYS